MILRKLKHPMMICLVSANLALVYALCLGNLFVCLDNMQSPCLDSLRNGMEKYTIFRCLNRELTFSIKELGHVFLMQART
jgi:hypothetical protein